jgi:iron complex transport system permease protein
MDYLLIRMLCSFLTGTLTSQAGSLVQLGTRNILSSPSTLGFEALTIFWLLVIHATSLFLSGSEYLLILGIPVFICVALFCSKFLGKETSLERVILLGLTFNLLMGAIFSLWQFFFLALNLPFPMEVWFGNFRLAHTSKLWWILTAEVLLVIFYYLNQKKIYLYSLGEDWGRALRTQDRSLFYFIFIAAILSTYIIVTLFGAFAFLGLIFPIISRKLWFPRFDIQGEFLLGAVVNGLLLMLIDAFCYHFPLAGAELPVGLLMSVVGAVSLILILWKSSRASQLLAK